jgi:predicted secreted protein
VPSRRDRLTDAYNRGFKAYAGIHRACLPTTEEASTRLARDGERLAKLLAGRFGG